MNGNRAGSHCPGSHCSQTTFHCSAATSHGNEQPQEPTLPAQPVLPSSSVARMKMGVGAVEIKYSRTSAAPSHPRNSPPAKKAGDSCSAGLGRGMGRKIPPPFTPCAQGAVRKAPLPPAPPLLLYDQSFLKSHFPRMLPGAGVWDWCCWRGAAPVQLLSKAPNPALGLPLLKGTGEP